MHHKIQWRYFAALLIPSLVILLLAVWLTFYTHSRGMEAMRKDVEKSNLRVAESIAENIDTLLEQVRQSASNLAIQIDKAGVGKGYQLVLYRNTIDQMTYLQLNAESLLNPVVNRGYVFLFEEDRAITQSSAQHRAQDLYERYFRVNDEDYAGFKRRFTAGYYAGTLLAEIPVGYLDELYYTWAVAQTIPADPTQSPRGVIVFTLDSSTLRQRLSEGLADEDSLCLLSDGDGGLLVSQGADMRWGADQIDGLLSSLGGEAAGIKTLRLGDGAVYLVTVAQGRTNRIVTAQPVSNAYRGVYDYNTGMLLLAFCMAALCVTVALISTRRNVNSVRCVIDSIAPENQSESATNVFEYMQEAIRSSQRREALLAAHANEQHSLLQDIFLKRLLRGEFMLASDLIREQNVAGVSLEGKYYLVLLLLFRQVEDADAHALREIAGAMCCEFGREHVRMAEMSAGHVACLLMMEEPDLRESVESVAELLSAQLGVACFASSTVLNTMDIPRAYREVRVMARMSKSGVNGLIWYVDLFQDDALYNFEYSQYAETKLCNSIAAGNLQSTRELLGALYENSMKDSIRSAHVLRFFAYDLYRLASHIGADAHREDERYQFLAKLRDRMDSVIDHPKNFDGFFAEIQQYCLRICEQNSSRCRGGQSELVQNILRYIDEQFTDPLLSVGGIAQHFAISDKYLSQLFKEQTNEKISSHIENKRIAHACVLLKTTGLSINEVATASGYALTHTFRVAFKKAQGVTPLQWKNMNAPNG